jgi:hypothetical protein
VRKSIYLDGVRWAFAGVNSTRLHSAEKVRGVVAEIVARWLAARLRRAAILKRDEGEAWHERWQLILSTSGEVAKAAGCRGYFTARQSLPEAEDLWLGPHRILSGIGANPVVRGGLKHPGRRVSVDASMERLLLQNRSLRVVDTIVTRTICRPDDIAQWTRVCVKRGFRNDPSTSANGTNATSQDVETEAASDLEADIDAPRGPRSEPLALDS